MGLFARLFAPEITSLQSRINDTETLRDWYKQQAEGQATTISRIRSELKKEIERNRQREDALINQIIQLGGGHGIASHIEQAQPDLFTGQQKTPDLAPEEEDLLRERAREYAAQRYPAEEITPALLNDLYQQLAARKDEYL